MEWRYDEPPRQYVWIRAMILLSDNSKKCIPETVRWYGGGWNTVDELRYKDCRVVCWQPEYIDWEV